MTEATLNQSPLVARWRTMPRAMRWAVIALVAMGAYFAAVEPALAAMSKWSSRADGKQAQLDKYHSGRAARKEADAAAALGVTRFGLVEAPGDATQRSLAFNRKVAEVLEKNGIQRPTTSSRQVPVSNNSALARQMGNDFRVERLVSDVSFDAEPEQIAKVVAELEKTPEISTVSRVQIRQIAGDSNGRLVRATLAVEAWQYQKKGRTK